MTQDQVRELMLLMHGAWPSAEIDEAVAIVWRNALSPMDRDRAYMAIGRLIEKRRFFPTVADFNGELTAMRDEERREEETVPALPASGPWVHPREGVKIALAEYERECDRQGRTPNPAMIDGWLRSVGLSR